MSDSIDSGNNPLAFKVLQGPGRSPVLADYPGRDVFKVDAWQLAGHQRKAIVTEGASGNAWRVASDEGVHLKGTDLAPFPFGFFNAGLQGDLMHRIRSGADARGIAFQGLEIHLDNEYGLIGSFELGTARGQADPTQIEIRLRSGASDDAVSNLISDALDASPAIALLRAPVTSSFALYVNGQRRSMEGVANSPAPDAQDPLAVYPNMLRPLNAGSARRDMIEKTSRRELGSPALAPAGTTTRLVRSVTGEGRLIDPAGLTEIETWLKFRGASHFMFRTDEGFSDAAPSGLALLSAGLAFCYMTQLSRYIEHMPAMAAFRHGRGARVVQYSPYALVRGPRAGQLTGTAEAIDTHLFLTAQAPDAAHAELLTLAARTCFLRATAAGALPPVVRVVLNGTSIN